jgi:CubicO group peptidase (beta-lactamase class C family)
MVQPESTSGWDPKESGYDPSFYMRETALALGLTDHIDQTQYVQFQLKQKLQYKPGTHAAYCNFCVDVLGMVVAKASGMTFIQYLQSQIATPAGAGEIAISPTVGARLPGEVAHYYNSKKGKSAFYPTMQALVPLPYGGDGGVLEVAQGDGGAATSAESMLALMNHYTIWGFGKPPPAGTGESRAGGIPGTETWAEQLPNRTNYAFDVNTNDYEYGGDPGVFQALQGEIKRHLCKNAAKCGAYNPI